MIVSLVKHMEVSSEVPEETTLEMHLTDGKVFIR
ncbi:hypothetical protein QOZ98_000100 [Planomicrobium stackebrandtii]|uniref:Uncharacterized protein n=1 Tax=Planomicrobium stackebrandtii TaxID=253160 RepID=A0ABU0GPJ1_9BACL|nr:hypothetical protein [Planomicrobium stackebrandtii]